MVDRKRVEQGDDEQIGQLAQLENENVLGLKPIEPFLSHTMFIRYINIAGIQNFIFNSNLIKLITRKKRVVYWFLKNHASVILYFYVLIRYVSLMLPYMLPCNHIDHKET